MNHPEQMSCTGTAPPTFQKLWTNWITSCAIIEPARRAITIPDCSICYGTWRQRWDVPLRNCILSAATARPGVMSFCAPTLQVLQSTACTCRPKRFDIRLPGTSTSAFRNAALALHRGVGYYLHSAFIHVDLGRVRKG